MLDNIINEIKSKLTNDKVIVACSTGVDSTVLLNLVELSLDKKQIIICHVNHQKRVSSIDEETYIKEFAKENNLKCYIKRLDHVPSGSNFQEWAREERYKFFIQTAETEGCKYILLAHHADDNLETIIMRLVKSSSLKGYAGMESESKISGKDIYIYRPLLKIPKKDLISYANNKKLKYFEDESNQTGDYTRNRIRHQITPILLEENPNLYEAINSFSETILNANQLLEKEKLSFIENKVLVNNNSNEIRISFKQNDFINLSSYLQVQILFRILKPFSLSRSCIDDLIKQINNDKPRVIAKINNHLNFIKEYKQITFGDFDITSLEYYKEIYEEGIYQLPNNQVFEVTKNICYFTSQTGKIWYNIDKLPLIIRTRVSGDKIKTMMGTISISDYLTNKKVPYLERKDLLLLCDNESVKAILGYVIKTRKEK